MMTRVLLPLAVALPLYCAGWLQKDSFTPANRLSGVGVDREKMSDIILQRRSQLMTDSMTFAIMRDPEALAGAQRINSPKLQRIFQTASRQSGLPASFLSAISYLESWG